MLKTLDDYTNGIADIPRNAAQRAYKDGMDSVREFQRLHNNILLLSVTISGVVVPILLDKVSTENARFFLLSIILFGMTVLFGVIMLAVGLSNEPRDFFDVSARTKELVGKVRDELQRIRQMNTDSEASEALKKLKDMYGKELDSMRSTPNFLMRHKDAIFYGLFITAFLSLLIGIISNI